jgi:hypothetical protein
LTLEEHFGYLQVSILKQEETPEIWVAAGEGCSFLQKFRFALTELPSQGELFSEQDRLGIKVPFILMASWHHAH